jgi:hypothetical protein
VPGGVIAVTVSDQEALILANALEGTFNPTAYSNLSQTAR